MYSWTKYAIWLIFHFLFTLLVVDRLDTSISYSRTLGHPQSECCVSLVRFHWPTQPLAQKTDFDKGKIYFWATGCVAQCPPWVTGFLIMDPPSLGQGAPSHSNLLWEWSQSGRTALARLQHNTPRRAQDVDTLVIGWFGTRSCQSVFGIGMIYWDDRDVVMLACAPFNIHDILNVIHLDARNGGSNSVDLLFFISLVLFR